MNRHVKIVKSSIYLLYTKLYTEPFYFKIDIIGHSFYEKREEKIERWKGPLSPSNHCPCRFGRKGFLTFMGPFFVSIPYLSDKMEV